MKNINFDIVVVGAGPGGYVAAIRASQLGFKTAIVENNHLGGICLNWGCIPTKAMLHTSELYRNIKNAHEYGLSTSGFKFDLKKIVNRSRKVSAKLNAGVGYLLKKHAVTIINGRARLSGSGKIEVTHKNKNVDTISAKHTILATGARPNSIPGLEIDSKLIWSYFEALQPNTLPNSILVIGGGAIGVEFASFFQTFGTKVIIVEMLDRILPNEDLEISSIARKRFEASGMRIMTSAKLTKFIKYSNHVTCLVEDNSGSSNEIKVDRVISAVGVSGNVENIGLDNTKIKIDQGHILTDEYSRTDEPNIYAIGDVTGPPWLAHKAEHEGVICVEKIAGQNPHPLNKLRIPSCTYCYPQIASIGLTETVARKKGFNIKIGRFPFLGNGKAIAMGEEEGMIKTIFDKETGQLLGAHMIGKEVTELIQGFVIAMGLETTEEDLIHAIFPHPTLSEMMHESVLDAFERAIHI